MVKFYIFTSIKEANLSKWANWKRNVSNQQLLVLGNVGPSNSPTLW